jgi:hypothetical protein
MKTRKETIDEWSESLFREFAAAHCAHIDPDWLARRLKRLYPSCQELVGKMFDWIEDKPKAPPAGVEQKRAASPSVMPATGNKLNSPTQQVPGREARA